MLLSLTYFKYIFFVTKLSFFPKFCLPRKPSLLLEEDGPNKTKRDEQELNHQRGNGVGKFMATTKREREAFDLCGISPEQKEEYTTPCECGEICFIHCLWGVELASILCK